MFAAVQSLVQCALFTGADFCYQRQTPSFDCDQRLCQSLRAGALSPYLWCLLSVSSLLHLYWRVLYTWCHDGSELLHSSSFHSCRNVHIQWNMEYTALLWTALQLPVHLPVFTKKDVRKSSIIIPVGSIISSTFLLYCVIYTTRRYQSLTVMTDDRKISPLIV